MEINYIRTQVEPISHKYTVRIDRDITEPSDFQEELATIRVAGEQDVIHLLINSGGGQLDTAKAFLTSLAQSPAHIITEIEGEACSAATLLFLAGDEFRVSDDASFMIHSASYGYYGKENNVRQYVEHQAKATERLLRKYYKGFLTEEEIVEVINGRDVWMNSDEIMERLEQRQKLFEEEEAKSLQEIVDFEDEQLPREKLESLDKETLIRLITGEMDDEEFNELFGDVAPDEYTEVGDLVTIDKGAYGIALADKNSGQFKAVYSLLKEVAHDNGIPVAHNIGLEKLFERVEDFVEVV